MIKKYKLKPRNLELEITETSVVKSIEDAVKALNTFRDEGFSVALDDFGTGVSSLSYLKKLPISILKIDKSFIDDVPQSEKDSSYPEGDSRNRSHAKFGYCIRRCRNWKSKFNFFAKSRSH